MNNTTIDQIKAFMDSLGLLLDNQLVKILLIIIGTIIINSLLKRVIKRFTKVLAKNKTGREARNYIDAASNIIHSIAKGLVWVLSCFTILGILGMSVTTVLTSAGFLGVFITFIFQDLIKDVTSGFFFVFDETFKVGDRVQIGMFTGVILQINSRTIVLRDESNNKHIIANRSIDRVTVLSREIVFK